MVDERTVFKRVDLDLSALLHYIDIGDIGLPDIQRPFVWTAAKVRDLFDSMYRGFPVGYLLFWMNAGADGAKPIGLEPKAHQIPRLLIVDGQQRLTSLYAVFKGKPVRDDDYREITIKIAFRPEDGKFEVTDAAVQRDPAFVANISELWASGKSSRRMVNEFLDRLKKSKELSEADEENISHNLDRLFDLQRYPFTALEIAPSVDEEQVANIFVRINSQGVKLNQADFILTLLSVFWDEGRKELEEFSRASHVPPGWGRGPSPFNHFLAPGPDQLLRVEIATGFYRGRLKSVYEVLRGKDLDTGAFSVAKREEQFGRLKEAQSIVLDLTNWHQFFSSLVGAGFRSFELISSENAVLYAYSFYLIGRTRFHVEEHRLQRLIGRWFYASTLSGRYTSSPETVMDSDLNRVKDLVDRESFVSALERIITDTLTGDFWTITVANELETSSARSPALFAYHAAQNILGAPVLFSHKRVSDLLDPTVALRKKSLDRHHLFPRAWLEAQGVTDLKMINQAANMAFLEWPDNIEISDEPPAKYVPLMRSRFDAAVWREMCDFHALPSDWEALSYEVFLQQRRRLMAEIIRRGFQRVGEVSPGSPYVPPTELAARFLEPVSEGNGGSEGAEKTGLEERNELRHRFWSEFLPRAAERTPLHAHRSPTVHHWIGGSAGKRGLSLNYFINPHRVGGDLYIDRGKDAATENKRLFDSLASHRPEIEGAFGGPLVWERLEDKRACRIRFDIETGGYRDEEKWAAIQNEMIDGMTRLEGALRRYIAAL